MSVDDLEIRDSIESISRMTPDEILRIRRIHGIHYKFWERVLRPSAMSIWVYTNKWPEYKRKGLEDRAYPFTGGGVADSGYIGILEDFRYVLAYQAEVVGKLGTTNDAVSKRLEQIKNFYEDFRQRNGNFVALEAEYTFRDNLGKRKKIIICDDPWHRIKGGIPSPIPISDRFPVDITIIDPQNDLEVVVTELHYGFIRDYGFYESCDRVIPHRYAILPDVLVVLGLSNLPLEEARRLHDEIKSAYMGRYEEEKEQRRQLIEESPVLEAFGEIGQCFPNFKRYEDWINSINDKIDYYERLNNLRGGFEARIKRFKHAREYVENLRKKGIDFAEEYILYFFERFDYFPWEDGKKIYELEDFKKLGV